MTFKKWWFEKISNTTQRVESIEIGFFLVSSDGEEYEYSSKILPFDNKKEYYFRDARYGMEEWDKVREMLQDPKLRQALHKEMTAIWSGLPEEIHLNDKWIFIKPNLIGMHWKNIRTECVPISYEDHLRLK
jgi:hypothetical protein